MKKFLTATLALSLLFGCSEESSKTCTPDTPLAKVGDRVITVSYYEKVENALPAGSVKRFHSGKKLLDEIVERHLILLDSLEKGIFENPEIKEKVERYRIKRLAYRFLNSKVGDYSVSDREVEEFIKKRYAGKEVTPELKRKVKVNLEAKKFVQKRQEILNRISSEVRFVDDRPTSPEDVIAVYKGEKIRFSDVKSLLGKKPSPEKLKKAVLEYVLYKRALKEGLDKNGDFLSSYNRFLASLAVKEFKKRVLSSVKVTDEEIKNYYEKHKGLFKRPPEAEVVIYEFRSKEDAERALSKGSLKGGRVWKVTAADADCNPVSTLVFKEKKDRGIIPLPDGRALLVVVKRRLPARELLYGDAYQLIKEKLTLEKAERLYKQEIEKLKEKFGVKYYKENLVCIS
ncbi:peptidyl-prolyl cis-trans isomerase [Phorcysia thermohydrogeniphila]|uniref:Parvulin-like peptidyl-prolyl cis-trans isomerase protein n=1 Tax=Phorcysia thermohydrogeniphila TaxID=936138 RepID=A0A4R1GPC5_9BACT|nr:peptidylprolyl isomerase [Phorcysia thermohydrogeniphila]TCK06312.1 parvulin-like peptidyl-prolyl cis-trans isomerase protein [Phorcysia thermohydrogeniphila]